MATMIRWNPIREMAAMQSALDRMFEDNWRAARGTATNSTLALDVYETDQAYMVYAALPGANADNISVNLHEGVLTVAGEIAAPTPAENARLHMQERTFGKFSRSLRMPQQIDANNVEAAFENGVLVLTLPKTPEAQPRQIPVRVGMHSSN
jgi:HSP20 family protein